MKGHFYSKQTVSFFLTDSFFRRGATSTLDPFHLTVASHSPEQREGLQPGSHRRASTDSVSIGSLVSQSDLPIRSLNSPTPVMTSWHLSSLLDPISTISPKNLFSRLNLAICGDVRRSSGFIAMYVCLLLMSFHHLSRTYFDGTVRIFF